MLTRIFLLFLLAQSVFGQVNDDFSSPTLSSSWTGDRNYFQPTAGLLESSGPSTAGGNIFLAASVPGLNAMEWNVLVNMKFAPSGTNYLRYYLNASLPTLNTASVNGYYIQIGETNQDTIKLYKQTAGIRTKILSSTRVCLTSTSANYSNVRINVLRDNLGTWTVSSDCAGGNSFVSDGTVFDNMYTVPGFFGPNCIYGTPSRYNLFQLDDVYLSPIGFDNIRPSIQSVTVTSINTLDIQFSEPLDSVSASAKTNYLWSENQTSPTSAILSSNRLLVHLTFAAPFPSFSTQQITVAGVKDINGNSMNPVSQLFTYTPSIPLVHDNFTDGDFTRNPVWSGTPNSWTIDNAQLRSASSTPNAAFYLSTPFNRSGTNEWEWSQQLAFNPSSANYTDIYLQANSSDLTSNSLSGYFVRVGNAADEVSLYKISNGVAQVLINGRDGILNTSYNVLKINVKRDNLSNWQLFTDVTGTGDSYLSEGTTVDAAFPSGSSMGIKVQQSTASFFGWHYLDDIYAGPTRIDSIALSMVSVTAKDDRTLEIMFSEKIDTISMRGTGVFLVNNTTAPSHISVLGTRKIQLTFNAPFASGMGMQLQVTNLKDAVGNSFTGTSSFVYVAPVRLSFRDVVINEIYADESPSNGLPECEYIELYNRTAQPINLQGFKLRDGSIDRIFTQVATVPSNGWIVVCSSISTADQLKSLDPALVVVTLSGLSLTNGGENLQLIDKYGDTIDKLVYKLDWYKDENKSDGGWSLEQVNPFLPCVNSSNWKASSHALGGTPGKANSVFSALPDTISPVIQSVRQINDTDWSITFSEPVDTMTLLPTSFRINNGITVQAIDSIYVDGSGVNIRFGQPIQKGKSYRLVALNVKDCSGNSLDSVGFSFGIGRSPHMYELVINELFADETPVVGLPEAEFVELVNNTADLIALDSLQLWDESSFARLPNEILLPGEYIILTPSTHTTKYAPLGRTIGLTNFPSLNNASDKISLKNKKGQVVHSVSYSDSWYRDETKKEGGWSLEMMDSSNPCGQSENWKASTHTKGGTPGSKNSVQQSNPDLQAPMVRLANVTDSITLQIQFNEALDSMSTNPIFKTEGTHSIKTWKFGPAGFSQLVLFFQNPLEENVLQNLTVSGLADCKGNTQPLVIQFVRPSKAIRGNLIINEILFNPYTGGADFVEVYNRSTDYIDLFGWKLANITNDSVANRKSVTDHHRLIAPQGFVVFTTDTHNIRNNYPRAVNGNFAQLASLPSYNDDEGTVVLMLPTDSVAEQFSYTQTMHFKLLDDKEGVSLERISPDLPVNGSSSWHSASVAVGYATPGYANSQQASTGGNANPFSVDPEAFTPDGDGNKDFTLLRYQFAKSGQVANITIYDPKGRKVRSLAKNELLATEGTYQWDGTDDSGNKAAIGLYLIHAEVFDLEGKSGFYVKKVAVGARFE